MGDGSLLLDVYLSQQGQWMELGYGNETSGLVESELDRAGRVLNLCWTGLILNLQLDHLLNQQLVLVSLSISIKDLLDSFGETFSQGPGSTPGSRTAPNYGNLYLDGLITEPRIVGISEGFPTKG
ncbi:hypothetical protein F2Q70_00026715 [Brassica cretica]|uniref:Uncharacterized protein n=1 Tax=Brassica cretica TaxID=69181 RepID=A0A8S9LCW4_BRACR|nr:hypothetical protein F2Q70_00026715 [Brassica cretica]